MLLPLKPNESDKQFQKLTEFPLEHEFKMTPYQEIMIKNSERMLASIELMIKNQKSQTDVLKMLCDSMKENKSYLQPSKSNKKQMLRERELICDSEGEEIDEKE